MKNKWTTSLRWLMMLLPLCWGCQDEEVVPVFENCPEGDTYALDFRAGQASGNRIWLTDADNELAFDEGIEGGAAMPYFVNLEGACSDVYTLSTAGYPTRSNGNPAIYSQNFLVQEFGSVPHGSILDIWSGLSDTFFGSLDEGTIRIEHCPPIDSVRLLTVSDPREGYGAAPRISYEYLAEDSLLLIHTQKTYLWATDILLAIRRTDDGAWAGFSFAANFTTDLPTLRDYAELEPMPLRQAFIDWPTQAQDASLVVLLIQDMANRRAQVVAKTETPGLLELPLLDGMDGPFLFHFQWRDEFEREIRRVEPSWQEKLAFFPSIEGQLLSYDYPMVQYASTGASLVTLDGVYRNPNLTQYCRRRYAGPVSEDGALTLSPLSPWLDDANSQLIELYQNAIGEDASLDFYHYPAMRGQMDWYLRNVVSDLGSGQSWLESLEFERLHLPF